MLNLKKTALYLSSALLIIMTGFLSGCSTSNSIYNTSQGWTAADYLQLADNAYPPKKADYLLAACSQYIQNRQSYNAQMIIDSLTFGTLDVEQQIQYQLLQAHIMVLNGINMLQLHNNSIKWQPITPCSLQNNKKPYTHC